MKSTTTAAAAVMLSFVLTGCISTSEMPLAKNVWQIHTETGGVLFTGMADKATLKRAAELTLAQGYTHFLIQNPNTQSGEVYAGSTQGFASTNLSMVGNTAYGTTTYTPGVPLMKPVKNVSVTVVMFHENEPQAAQALDAVAMLKRLSG
jgi:hypothetical protein